MMTTDIVRAADGRFDVVRSRTCYQGNIFSVRVDEVSMPGGGTATRDVVDHLRAVGVAAVDEQDRVVMVEQYRHPLRRRLWELPAGLMDVAGEAPLVTAQRELVEEAALRAEEWSVLVDLATSPGFSTETIRVYLATGLHAVPAPERHDEEADMRVVRVPLADAVTGVFSGTIVNATAVAGVLAAARVRRIATGTVGLRAADGWTDGPATVNGDREIGTAPRLESTPE